MRRAPASYKDNNKQHNKRLSAGPRAQHHQVSRGSNGDRAKAAKGKEKKDNASKAKDDKVCFFMCQLMWQVPVFSEDAFS